MRIATFQRTPSKPRLFRVADRIAARLEPKVAAQFLAAVEKWREQISVDDLRAAVAGGDLSVIEAAVGAGRLEALLLGGGALEGVLHETATLTGKAGADVLGDVTGLETAFNARDPAVVQTAREDAAKLVTGVDEEAREAIRVVTAAGADLGLTTAEQAAALKETVGLLPKHARAVTNLRGALKHAMEAGTDEAVAEALAALRGKRLDAALVAEMSKKLKDGTLTAADIARVGDTYSESLLNYRAKMIARTESIRAANAGQYQGFRQAIQQGTLPADTRRLWVVTQDDRLEHGDVPGMNAGGVGIDEMFQTPEGQVRYPPSRPHCRCSTALTFPGLAGIL